jgi:hypothetical protein
MSSALLVLRFSKPKTMINTTTNKDELPPYSVNRLGAEAEKKFA